MTDREAGPLSPATPQNHPQRSAPTSRVRLSEREFHRQVVRALIALHRTHKRADEHAEAAECLELARRHVEHVLACPRSTDPRCPVCDHVHPRGTRCCTLCHYLTVRP